MIERRHGQLDLLTVLSRFRTMGHTNSGGVEMSTRVAKRNGVVILKPNGKLIGNAVNELSQTIHGELPKSGDNPKAVN